jgi:hypothetical protein
MIAPGLHPDLDPDIYRALERLSPSGAGKIAKSPAHYRVYKDAPDSDTAAYRMGRALHALALEGREVYASRFAVAPECDRRTKAGKETWESFHAEAAGRAVLSATEAAPVEAMAAALAAHPLVPALLQGGRAEVSMIWEDPETGTPCKGRPDFARFSDGALLDLKTALDASPAAFARAAHGYGYGTQAAAYLAGAAALGFEVRDYVLIVVEKGPPFGVACYRLPDAALELGRRRWREAVEVYRDCLERGTWPGYPETITELALPGWAMTEFCQEEQA